MMYQPQVIQPTVVMPQVIQPQVMIQPQMVQPQVVHQVIQTQVAQPEMQSGIGPRACRVTCPACKKSVQTNTRRKTTCMGHTAALILCFIGCVPCCLIPYCMDSCKNIDHYCPNCSAFIGTYYN